MYIALITKKNNALTDGNIPSRGVLPQKLLNVLNSIYEKEGNKFSISMNELARKLDITVNSGKTKKMLQDALTVLQQPIQLRNFEYNGRGIKWISAPFLSESVVFTDSKSVVEIEINDKIINGLKQKNHYTMIDLNISNKFKTKYGIVLWELFSRYKNQNRNGTPEQWTYQKFTLEELNEKFNTNYKHNSEMLRSINRGLKEVKSITNKDITVNFQKDIKAFVFYWEKEKQVPKYLKSEKAFIAYIREKYMPNSQENKYPTIAKGNQGEELKVNYKGYLYGRKDDKTIDYNAATSQKIWTQLYKLAKKGQEF